MLSVLRRVVAVFALAGSAIALGTGVMVVISITLRALITKPIPGDVELTQFGVALAISLALPWCQMHGSNIIVDFFTQRLRERANRWLDGIGCLLIAVMCALLAWRTGVGAVAVREAHEASMILDLPMWWVYASLAPGLALTAVVALVQAAMYLRGDDTGALTGGRA
jgi:TRAP-type C4-dicarboxylate transport system permease small subunit